MVLGHSKRFVAICLPFHAFDPICLSGNICAPQSGNSSRDPSTKELLYALLKPQNQIIISFIKQPIHPRLKYHFITSNKKCGN